MAAPGVKGYLVLEIVEASSKNRSDEPCWVDAGHGLEAFVKVELRGGMRAVKATTQKKAMVGSSIVWRERLVMEVLDDSEELRLMVCKEKFQGTKKGVSVIAACGIFIRDILDASPIDKYFELFKPSAGGEGGYIRIGIDFVRDPKAIGGKKKGGFIGRLFKTALFLGAVGGAAFFAKQKLEEQQSAKPAGGKPAAKAPAKGAAPAKAPAKKGW